MNKAKILIVCLLILSLFSLECTAYSFSRVNITVNGKRAYEDKPLLYNGITYVPFRDFYEKYEGSYVAWYPTENAARAKSADLMVHAVSGTNYITANGRCLYYGQNILRGGKLYIPLRSAVRTLNGSVNWSSKTNTATAKTGDGGIKNGGDYYNQTDLYWLSRIISAESRGESLRGKIAVGNVVLNRTKHSNYPNTVKAVIFDTKHGVQFTPVTNGTIYDEPTAESVIAAKICLEGYSMNNNILYFMNEKISTSSWISQNCRFVFSIGNHDFYA